ncbi:YodC family protein [Acinetobacter tandoii]|uniref:DUF2158 domain-containing protein n=1 Tax=Acinetobacter tandoii DSM 14970 = CIP 107469 TaxID=1120927 RepID=R9AVD3_9GAMM|nr:DUF2158 domain-containing protein [Acinetobacter tandoii]EOR06000.1 hypothetical protein I593_02818 [Acinetobacter tandoii DSM 14970 = CIP 107469]
MIEERKAKFQVGDIVKLNAGGPDMAIKQLYAGNVPTSFKGQYRCQWFAGKKLDFGDFPEESLIPASKQEASSES